MARCSLIGSIIINLPTLRTHLSIVYSIIFHFTSLFPTVHLRGVDIVAQTTFTLTQGSQNLQFKGYGFELHVPEGSLPAEVSETKLNVLSGQFQMPPDCELFSAVYWVYSPHKFTKPLTVETQHCAVLSSDQQCAQNLPLFAPNVPRKSYRMCSNCEMEAFLATTVHMVACHYLSSLGLEQLKGNLPQNPESNLFHSLLHTAPMISQAASINRNSRHRNIQFISRDLKNHGQRDL